MCLMKAQSGSGATDGPNDQWGRIRERVDHGLCGLPAQRVSTDGPEWGEAEVIILLLGRAHEHCKRLWTRLRRQRFESAPCAWSGWLQRSPQLVYRRIVRDGQVVEGLESSAHEPEFGLGPRISGATTTPTNCVRCSVWSMWKRAGGVV